jgi:membrane-bound ClpP family serine protease
MDRRATRRRDDPLDQPDPRSVPRVSWRTELVGAADLTLLAGLFLILAPVLLFTYRPGDPALHDGLVGALIVVLTLVKLGFAPWRAELSWITFVIGLWLLVAAFLLPTSTTVRWTEAAIGGVVVVSSALSGSATNGARREAFRRRARRPRGRVA